MFFNNLPEVMTVKQLAEGLLITEVTVKRALKAGSLIGFKAGRDWRITREEVKSWIDRRGYEKSVHVDEYARDAVQSGSVFLANGIGFGVVFIPLVLKKRMDKTGLTVERLLELGCDAHLVSVQSCEGEL